MTERTIKLLSIDGGGVRGLSSLFLLQQLLQKVNQADPPLPYKYFDMIGGTSTGGCVQAIAEKMVHCVNTCHDRLIAIMLGILHMSVQECIDEYLTMMNKIFTAGGPPFDWRGRVKGRFSTRVFEECIRDILTRYKVPNNAKMREPGTDPECKTLVIRASIFLCRFIDTAVKFCLCHNQTSVWPCSILKFSSRGRNESRRFTG